MDGDDIPIWSLFVLELFARSIRWFPTEITPRCGVYVVRFFTRINRLLVKVRSSIDFGDICSRIPLLKGRGKRLLCEVDFKTLYSSNEFRWSFHFVMRLVLP